ncbi:hypothetical protein [Pedobacter sp. ASV28]|uniref:hypothetical protein n=1 Tax=Pedobacter sp. ASV28 TaxID=2795123 RepID=UPI0018EA93CC|nr:hypothetical protein [Pedobacter sp. ASV28]
MLNVFSQLRNFAEFFGELHKNGNVNEDFLIQADLLRSNWKGFRTKLEKRIEEQETPEKLSILIRAVQHNLTSFSNTIYDLYRSYETNDYGVVLKVMELFREIGAEANEILDFLYSNYPEYYDLTSPVSLWKIRANTEAYSKNSLIVWNLGDRNVEPELVEIIKDHLGILCDANNVRVKNWQQFFYMEVLADRLHSFVRLPKDSDDTFKVIKLLIGYDFNPLSFYEFMLEYATRKAGPDGPYGDQEMELLSLLRTIENIRPECKYGYNTEVPPISQSISGSIKRELKIIERMKAVHFPYPDSKKNIITNYYFETNTTLEELFLLIRVMLSVDFIKTRFKSNLYTFIERHIRTARTKKPSPQYMRNIIGREVPDRVVKKIRHWLVIMINYIDANFKDQIKIWTFGGFAIWFQEDVAYLLTLIA